MHRFLISHHVFSIIAPCVFSLTAVLYALTSSSDKEQLTRKQMIEKKKKLKAMFDAEYDDKEGSSFYDDLKRDLDQQAQVTTAEQKQCAPQYSPLYRNNVCSAIFSYIYSRPHDLTVTN